MQKNPFIKFNAYLWQKEKKTPLSKSGIEQEIPSLRVSVVPLRSKYQNRIRHRRDVLEEMLMRGNEKAWKMMRDLSDHDMNLTSGEGGEEEADGAKSSETKVQLLES